MSWRCTQALHLQAMDNPKSWSFTYDEHKNIEQITRTSQVTYLKKEARSQKLSNNKAENLEAWSPKLSNNKAEKKSQKPKAFK